MTKNDKSDICDKKLTKIEKSLHQQTATTNRFLGPRCDMLAVQKYLFDVK